MKHKKSIILLTILIILLLAAVYSYTQEGFIHFLFTQDIQATTAYIQSFGPLAAIILVLIVIIEVVAAPIPPLILYIVGGVLFGGFYGGTLILIGNVLGALIAFYIARTLGKDYLKSKLEKANTKRFHNYIEKYGTFAIFLLRINPITSSDLVSYLAGLTKMKTSRFALSTTLGLAPLVYIQSYLGSEIIGKNPFFLYIFTGISALYALIIIYLIIRLSRK